MAESKSDEFAFSVNAYFKKQHSFQDKELASISKRRAPPPLPLGEWPRWRRIGMVLQVATGIAVGCSHSIL